MVENNHNMFPEKQWNKQTERQTFIDGQQTQEKMLNITNHEGNKNQNHNEISLHSSNSGSYFFFNFTILYWFCHISTWIHHRYTHVPHPEPSSLLPPHTIPLGRPGAPAPSIQYRASNLDWRLVSYMILYMFQHHSPKSALIKKTGNSKGW